MNKATEASPGFANVMAPLASSHRLLAAEDHARLYRRGPDLARAGRR